MKNYKKAYAEVLYIINQLEKDDFERIPKKFIKMLETKRDKRYKINLSNDVSLSEQNLLEETRILLAIVYDLYLDDKEDKLSKE